MKLRLLILSYVFLVFVVGLFWRSGYRADASLQAMFAKPDPAIDHHSVESAKKEIEYLRATQADLLKLNHQAHVLHSQAAVFTLVAGTLLLMTALRQPRGNPKIKSTA